MGVCCRSASQLSGVGTWTLIPAWTPGIALRDSTVAARTAQLTETSAFGIYTARWVRLLLQAYIRKCSGNTTY